MKKLQSVMLAVTLLFSVFVFSYTFADTTNVNISVSSAFGSAGDTVSVDITADCKSVVGIDGIVEYNTDALSLVGAEPYEELFTADKMIYNSEDYSVYPYYVGWEDYRSEGITGEGKLVKLTFLIKDNAYNGSYPIDINDINVIDNSLEDIPYAMQRGFVNVSGGEECPYETTLPTIRIKPTYTTFTTTAPPTESSAAPTSSTEKSGFKVIIDDAVSIVEPNSFLTLPEYKSGSVIAYTDGADYYFAGDKLTVTGDMTFTSVDLSFDMTVGAAMRYKNPTGIRFYSKVNTELIDSLRAKGAQISLGTLISLHRIVGEQDFTKNMSGKFGDVKYESLEWYADDSGFKGFVGSVVNILDKNVNVDFVGRGYITCTFNGKTTTVYGSYDKDITSNSRSICYIANRVMFDEIKYLSSEKAEIAKYYADRYTGSDKYTISDPFKDDIF